ncbi:MAG: hypothetical protein J6Y02_23895 [Pseudobutyrivibrio sp.]|nr:hypothetical protein [Pseudobutyrivibrio sp.]
MKDRYFMCPECNRKMVCSIYDEGKTLQIKLQCTNPDCEAESNLELSSNRKIDGTPIKKSDLYPIVKGYLQDLRKRVKHSDYRNDLYSGKNKGQVTIDDVLKENRND